MAVAVRLGILAVAGRILLVAAGRVVAPVFRSVGSVEEIFVPAC
jgi:hypothetical protein